jgi:signal peptidase I
VTDDDDARARVEAAQLRSRIEARVAARRKSSKRGDESDAAEPEEQAPRGPRSLAPTRRWGRPQGDAEPADSDEAAEPTPSAESLGAESLAAESLAAESETAEAPTVKATRRRRGVEPARPWAARSTTASDETAQATEPEPAPEPEPPANARGRERLKPARRWGRAAQPETPVEAAAEASAVAPSNPDSVLRGLAAEAAIASGEATPDDFDSEILPHGEEEQRRRLFGRRTEDERADAQFTAERAALQHLDELRREAARVEAARIEAERLADEQRQAVERLTAEHDRLATEHAEAEQLLAERRREADWVEARRAQMEQLVEEHRNEAERYQAERVAAEQQATEELAAKRAEADRAEAERVAAEQLVAEHRAEVDRLAAERATAEQAIKDRRTHASHLAREQAEVEELIAARRAEIARLEAERVEVERLVSEQRLEAERASTERPTPAGDHVVPVTSDRRRRLARRPSASDAVPAAADASDTPPETVPAETVLPEAVPADGVVASLDEHLEPAAAMVAPEQGEQPEVDLDLQGAPTWDPAMYAPETEAAEQHRTRRAMRWLFARTPDEEAPAAAQPALGDVSEPVSDVSEPVSEAAQPIPAPAEFELEAGSPELVDLELAEALPVEPAPEPATAAADDLAVPPSEAEPVEPVEQPAAPAAHKESVLSRLFARKPEPAEADDDAEETAPRFPLPAPDAAFEEPWVRSPAPPRPTRDWAKGGTPAAEVEPVEQPEPATPHLEPEPVAAQVEPEPVVPSRRPTPGAPAATRRPSPGASSPRRPSPGVPAAASASIAPAPAAPATATPAPSRPSPGATAARKPLPFELASGPGATALAGRPSPGSRTRQPDVGTFLESPSAAAGDDDDEEDDQSGGSGDGRNWRRFLIRTFIIVFIAGLAAVLLRAYVVQPYYIPSASMEPTLHGCPTCNDDHVLVDKISYDFGDPKASDIVVFHRPKNAHVSDNVLIKRVIGLPNDKISMTRGQVFVNGKPMREPYLNKDHSCYATSTFSPLTVPAKEVFVMGDNRCDSTDSRAFGPIAESSIIGRAFAIIWPIHRISWLG